MKALRVVLALSFLLLGGCLVVFREPLPANEQPPMALLGEWTRTNEWGEQMFLDISRSGDTRFKARLMAGSPDNLEGAEGVRLQCQPQWAPLVFHRLPAQALRQQLCRGRLRDFRQ